MTGLVSEANQRFLRFRRPLKDEFDNGKEYYALQGKTIVLPGNPAFRPSTEQLGWHNEHVYRPA